MDSATLDLIHPADHALMAKKPAKKAANKPAKKAPQTLAIRVSDEDRKTKVGGKSFPISAFIHELDAAKLDALCAEYCINSRVAAARYAIKRWHRYLTKLAERPGYKAPERPEFAIGASSNSGASLTKFYLYQDDLDRLENLAHLTGKGGMGQLIRAAVGWAYENMDV